MGKIAHVSSKVNISKVLIAGLKQAAITCLEQTGEALHTQIIADEVMPFDQGTMQNEQTFVDTSASKSGTVTLTTTSPQARRLYFHPEYDYQRVNNANAGGLWADDYIDGSKKDFCKTTFKKLYKLKTGV
ncbi:hypothetical protein SAMN04515656_10342 [Eubacterium aggregans]|uniref:Minor capsid protein n=1 Tax=Eubacterium aggregans TaxID=81409 RepID=A0A1H3Y4G4_9FIRM|nr:hypothetical protein [Eubacterium aggregans]SEA05981.1 hypothetical protein SAMN04515656_10342 [Eubacterium aggregans]